MKESWDLSLFSAISLLPSSKKNGTGHSTKDRNKIMKVRGEKNKRHVMKGLVSCTRKPQLSRATSTEHRMSLRHLLLGRKAVINLDSILKSRDSTLLTKVRLVQAMVFPVVPYGCGSWTIMKAEYQRIDAFELWCWRKLLRVPWTARKSNQSILKEISPGWSLEGSMLKLKLPILRPPDAKS